MRIQAEGGPTDEESNWRSRRVPENQAPASVAFDAMLARTDGAAVFVSGLRVYRNGVQLTIAVRIRTPLRDGVEASAVLNGHGPTVVLLGIELADGTRCVHNRRGWETAPAGPALVAEGGGGGSRDAELRLFLSPLPPPGTNKLLCAWPWLNITDQETLLPTDAILAAAANVVELWPWEPESPRPDPPILSPQPPVDSWFSPTPPSTTQGP